MTTKEKVLESLSENDFISGEILAEKYSVSRVAINKAINSLREEGYSIEAVTNKGYRIIAFPDNLEETKIRDELSRLFLETDKKSKIGKMHIFSLIDSTNTEAKRRCAAVGAFRKCDGELTEGGKEMHKTLFASSEQSAGRGRMGRTFVSPPNSGIYFSFVYSPKNGVTNPALLTAAAAVAVARSIDELYKLDSACETKIKWVNDVFLKDAEGNFKKISGILTEGIANFETGRIEAAIVGIGINVRNGNFKGEISKIAGSVEDILQTNRNRDFKVSRNEIIAHVLFHLINFYDTMEENSISETFSTKTMLSEYTAKSMLIGKEVQVNEIAGLHGETYKAVVTGITDKAELTVKTGSGEIKNLHSGEVSLHSYDFV